MQGLLARVRAGRELFNGTDNMLASAGFILEDAKFLELALANPTSYDHRADAASSVLGPKATGEMIDVVIELATRARTELAAGKALSVLEQRIEHVPGSSLLAAILERSWKLDSEQMARLAELVSRRRDRDSERGRSFGADAIRTIQMLVQDWGKRMLASGNAQRRHKAAVATLASHVPDVSLLPLLKEMLDDNLHRFRDFRAQAEATNWRHSKARDEAYWPMTHEYQRAFLAIKTPETAALMKEYLEDLDFGTCAATILAEQWRTANEPLKDKASLGGVDWSEVTAKRAARTANRGRNMRRSGRDLRHDRSSNCGWGDIEAAKAGGFARHQSAAAPTRAARQGSSKSDRPGTEGRISGGSLGFAVEPRALRRGD